MLTPLPTNYAGVYAKDLPIGGQVLFMGHEWEVKFHTEEHTVISRPGKVCAIWLLLPNAWPIVGLVEVRNGT